MALTIYKQPSELTPAYNDQWISCLSDGIANPDFKYIVQITVNGDTANMYEEDILQRPDGWLLFNAMDWVKNYIIHYFERDNVVLSYPINLATGKNVSVEVVIKDYYLGAIDDTQTINYQAFDACLTDSEFRNYDFADYIFNGTSGKYFLSKTVNTITPDPRVVIGQDFFIHFINNLANPIDSIEITLTRGSVLQTITIGSLPTPVNTYDIYQLDTNSVIFDSVTPQAGDIVTVNFYDVGAALLLQYEYELKSIWVKDKDYVIHYLDRDGNILFFHFELVSRNTATKTTNTVKVNKNVLNTTTGEYGSKTYDRETHVISTAEENTITLNTNWISTKQSEALKELWNSPILYLWDGTTLISIQPPLDKSYETKKNVNDSLINWTATFDLGVTETRQRGI